FVGVLLPPPASGALALTRLDGAGARVAADARVSGRIERMARDIVIADVLIDLLAGPIGEGTDLDRGGVPVHLADVGARLVLGSPQADGPRLELFQLALERAHFADVAAEHPHGGLAIEQVRPMERDHGFDFGRIGKY